VNINTGKILNNTVCIGQNICILNSPEYPQMHPHNHYSAQYINYRLSLTAMTSFIKTL